MAKARKAGAVASKCLDFFVGVCELGAVRDSYIGNDDKGWGVYGKSLMRFHAKSSRKVAKGKGMNGAAADCFGDGDTVMLRYDSVAGTLLFGLNGEWNLTPQFVDICRKRAGRGGGGGDGRSRAGSMNVVFGQAKDGGSRSARGKVLFPAVSLYKRGSEAALRLRAFTPIACSPANHRTFRKDLQRPRPRLMLPSGTLQSRICAFLDLGFVPGYSEQGLRAAMLHFLEANARDLDLSARRVAKLQRMSIQSVARIVQLRSTRRMGRNEVKLAELSQKSRVDGTTTEAIKSFMHESHAGILSRTSDISTCFDQEDHAVLRATIVPDAVITDHEFDHVEKPRTLNTRRAVLNGRGGGFAALLEEDHQVTANRNVGPDTRQLVHTQTRHVGECYATARARRAVRILLHLFVEKMRNNEEKMNACDKTSRPVAHLGTAVRDQKITEPGKVQEIEAAELASNAKLRQSRSEQADLFHLLKVFARMLVIEGAPDDGGSIVSPWLSRTPRWNNGNVCKQMREWLEDPADMESSLPPLLRLLCMETARSLRGRYDSNEGAMDPLLLREALVAALLACDGDENGDTDDGSGVDGSGVVRVRDKQHSLVTMKWENMKLWTKCLAYAMHHALAYVVLSRRVQKGGEQGGEGESAWQPRKQLAINSPAKLEHLQTDVKRLEAVQERKEGAPVDTRAGLRRLLGMFG